MPACPRSDVIFLGEVAVYHCWSRCVRRAFLCGQDPLTGNDYEYRRDWIRDFEESLAALFGIEVGFHAEMSNHIHLVLRTRPDVVIGKTSASARSGKIDSNAANLLMKALSSFAGSIST